MLDTLPTRMHFSSRSQSCAFRTGWHAVQAGFVDGVLAGWKNVRSRCSRGELKIPVFALYYAILPTEEHQAVAPPFRAAMA